MKKASLTAKQKAQRLREFGFNLGKGKQDSKEFKARVSRNWKKVKHFVENTKQTFVFQKADKQKLVTISRGIGKTQVTPKGFFVRVPKGTKKVSKLRVDKNGTVFVTSHGPKGGKRIEEIYPFDPVLLTEDPPRAITELQKRAAKKNGKIVLTVNGWNSAHTVSYTFDSLAYYLPFELLPKFQDPNLNPAYTKKHRTKNGKPMRGGTIKEFCNIFHVKITKYVTTKKRTRRTNRRR